MLLATTQFLIGLARPPVDRDEGIRLVIAESHDLSFASSDGGLLLVTVSYRLIQSCLNDHTLQQLHSI